MTNERSSTPVAMMLVGMAAGAAGALLLAPRSGKETREKIKGVTDNWQDHALTTTDKVSEKIKQGINKASTAVTEKANQATEVVDKTHAKAKQKINEADRSNHTVDELEDLV